MARSEEMADTINVLGDILQEMVEPLARAMLELVDREAVTCVGQQSPDGTKRWVCMILTNEAAVAAREWLDKWGRDMAQAAEKAGFLWGLQGVDPHPMTGQPPPERN